MKKKKNMKINFKKIQSRIEKYLKLISFIFILQINLRNKFYFLFKGYRVFPKYFFAIKKSILSYFFLNFNEI